MYFKKNLERMTPIEQGEKVALILTESFAGDGGPKSGACIEALERRKFKIWRVQRGIGATEVQNWDRI
jgi:hypothetical protein